MSIHNIYDTSTHPQFITDYNKSVGNNDRPHIFIKPLMITDTYITCIFEGSISGGLLSKRPCRTNTEAIHGSQPSEDVMIDNILFQDEE